MHRKQYFIGFLSIFFSFCVVHATVNIDPVEIATLYNCDLVTEPVLIELLHCPSMERLKRINQYGVTYHVKKQGAYNRYNHSVGVMMLLRQFGASLHEQIAGLLHDVSHTVWSHVGDHLFREKMGTYQDSYQDMIIKDFINKTEIVDILRKYDLTVEEILHKKGCFLMLERDLPDLCADRLEYNLYGGFIEGMISSPDIAILLDHLFFDKGEWFFDDIVQAKKLGVLSLYLTEYVFTDPGSQLLYVWASQVLRRALDINLIGLDDIHHATDDMIWHSLSVSSDKRIQQFMHKLINYTQYFELSDQSAYDIRFIAKFRGIDPWVETNKGLQRLTSLDFEYSQEFERVKQLVAIDGRYIKLFN